MVGTSALPAISRTVELSGPKWGVSEWGRNEPLAASEPSTVHGRGVLCVDRASLLTCKSQGHRCQETQSLQFSKYFSIQGANLPPHLRSIFKSLKEPPNKYKLYRCIHWPWLVHYYRWIPKNAEAPDAVIPQFRWGLAQRRRRDEHLQLVPDGSKAFEAPSAFCIGMGSHQTTQAWWACGFRSTPSLSMGGYRKGIWPCFCPAISPVQMATLTVRRMRQHQG